MDMWRRLSPSRRQGALHQREGAVRARAGRFKEHRAAAGGEQGAFAAVQDCRFVPHDYLLVFRAMLVMQLRMICKFEIRISKSETNSNAQNSKF
jgi:hypothetical protein